MCKQWYLALFGLLDEYQAAHRDGRLAWIEHSHNCTIKIYLALFGLLDEYQQWVVIFKMVLYTIGQEDVELYLIWIGILDQHPLRN